MTSGRKKIAIFIAFIATLAAVGTTVVLLVPLQRFSPKDDKAQLAFFREVVALVKKSYVDEVTDKKLIMGAVNGMLSSLDPHSAFLPAEPFKEMQVHTSGAFGGLGIEITMQEGRLTVIAPIEETPAAGAGIRSGDYIYRIDGTPTRGLNINECVKRMRGEKGTRVNLSIIRKGLRKPLEFPLIRDIIKVKSLRSQTLEKGIGYIRILQFQERTGTDFTAALAGLKTQNGGTLKALILDMRNNPGGLLDQAVSISNHFIGDRPGDATIVTLRGREGRKDFTATIGEKEPRYPMVVLINGGSASASEIIAGALQDHGKAVIMGTQSFGKASVQTIIPLRDGNGLLLTTARYYTPKGRSIQAKGIKPDITVEDARIPVKVKKDKGDVKERDLEHHLSNPGAVKEPPPAPKPDLVGPANVRDDYQILRALDLLKGWETITRREAVAVPPAPKK
jgi:carboxyl-terminal processing protease